MLIQEYIRTNKGTFIKHDVFTADSPYWKIIGERIYCVFATGKCGTTSYKESLSRVYMSEEEAIQDGCGCYYRLVSQLVS